MRIGFGFDVHCFAPNRRLVLGGVEIAHDKGLEGHSDADVILHAAMDAILGALALGDIGQHFPNTDLRFKDADSKVLCEHVVALICEKGYRVGNIDIMVMAEEPKIGPDVLRMRECMCQLLKCDVSAVSVKATTMEGMGFVGRKEGIAAQAAVILIPNHTG